MRPKLGDAPTMSMPCSLPQHVRGGCGQHFGGGWGAGLLGVGVYGVRAFSCGASQTGHMRFWRRPCPIT